MRNVLVEPSPPSAPDNATDLVLNVLLLLAPFCVGLLVGVAFIWFIKRRGWRAKVISTWPILVMFGTLAYIVVPCILLVELSGFSPKTILGAPIVSMLVTWPIILVLGPVFLIYIHYLKRREKWLRDSTVVYLSALSLTSNCIYFFWLAH